MIESLGIVALFTVLLAKEAGVPVPVPGDLLVVGAGVAAARGDVNLALALAAILLAGALGGSIQYALVRGAARRPLLALLNRFGVRRELVDRYADRLRRRGAGGVAVARMTPGVRVVAVAASGVSGIPFVPFIAGLLVGNAVFAGAHFALGVAVGEPALQLLSAAGTPILLVVALLVALAAAGAAGWWLLRRRRAALQTDARDVDSFPLLPWADAACPACLALTALGVREVER